MAIRATKECAIRAAKDFFLPATVPTYALGRAIKKYPKISAVVALILVALIIVAFAVKTKQSCDGVVNSAKATGKFFKSYDAIWFGVIWIGTAVALRYRRQRDELREELREEAKKLKSPRDTGAHDTYNSQKPHDYYGRNQQVLTDTLDHTARTDYDAAWG